MSVINEQSIPTPMEVKDELPLPRNLLGIKQKKDAELKEIIAGRSDKFIVIIGPCSAHDEDAVCNYISRLAKLNEKLGDKLFIIPRIYTNKPRTTGEGYKGMLHQPNPEKSTNIYAGIIALRKMIIRALSESYMPAADEMLYPENLVYVEDILGYIAVGARSVENQQHRLVASGIEQPIGMKNPTSGDISVMLNSIQAAQHEHTFLYRDHEVATSGNPYAHSIIRGSVDKYGVNHPNYHYEDLISITEEYIARKLQYPCIICDTNHSNSGKKFYEQPRIVSELLHNRKQNKDIYNVVKGVMIESYIEEGNCKIEDRIYGKSITDGCLGWEDSEKLLYYIADHC